MILSIEKLRQEYRDNPFSEDSLQTNPFDQFIAWLKQAINSKEDDPNAMVLSTVSSTSHPSSRSVLLKGIDKKGFLFFTNYSSRKAEQIKANPYGSLAFLWHTLQRQITIEGVIKKTSRKESIDYFAKRPRKAQIAAHISSQSAPLSSREELEETFLHAQKQFRSQPIPCPPNWGGYRLIPHRFEFWQGRKNRLHDRFLYVFVEGEWVISRLAP